MLNILGVAPLEWKIPKVTGRKLPKTRYVVPPETSEMDSQGESDLVSSDTPNDDAISSDDNIPLAQLIKPKRHKRVITEEPTSSFDDDTP